MCQQWNVKSLVVVVLGIWIHSNSFQPSEAEKNVEKEGRDKTEDKEGVKLEDKDEGVKSESEGGEKSENKEGENSENKEEGVKSASACWVSILAGLKT